MTEPMTMAAILGNIGDIVTEILSELTKVVTTITSNPLLLLFVIFGFVGTCVGMFKRIIY